MGDFRSRVSNALLAVAVAVSACGCGDIPAHTHSAPKTIIADGQGYLACEGFITIYDPSRDIASSSSSHKYEIVFTDDYGKSVDLKDVTSYTVKDAPEGASYAMAAAASPDNLSTTYSDGSPIQPGATVVFGKDGDGGKAIWVSKGKWKPVPCKGPFD